MYDADPGELERLVNLIRRDRGSAEGTGEKAVGEEEWEAATTGPGRKGKSYLELAKANEGHFAPGTGAGTENHYDKWKKFHLEALEKAAEAGAAGADLPDEAIAINGFACHFLTDAFASGHIVAKKLITDKAESAWAKQGTTGMVFKESAFTKSVGAAVLGDPAVARRLAGKQLKLVKWGDIDSTRFSEFLWQMAGKAPGDFFNGFAKTAHDALNESISKTPIEVENKRGDKWTLSGDSTLALSPDTKQFAKAAVEESFRNLVTVAKANESFDYTPLLERVWAYTPKPTSAGQAEVDKILKDLTDPNNAESQRRFAELAISNIEILVSELEGQGYMRDKPAAPTPAPRSGFPAFEPKF
jgi:hypothetical protein